MKNPSPKPIVCGTDFSKTSVEAADVAAAMARGLKTTLALVHVDEVYGMGLTDPLLFEKLTARRKAELSEEAHRLRSAGTSVEEHFLAGSVFDEMIDIGAKMEAQMIVVGAVGHGIAQRLLLGSVAERVAENSPVPTLVVRPGSRLGSWARGESGLRIVAGFDFSPAGDAALRWLRQMLEIAPCEISVLHVDWPPSEAHRIGYRGPLGLTSNPEEIQTVLERDLMERIGLFLPPEKVTVRVEPNWGRPEANLFAMAREQEADLVVVGTHQRHGLGRMRFGSVSRTILRQAEASVAVIPPRALPEPPRPPKIARVLVATDFSELGNHAVAYACAATERGGTVKIIHVIQPETVATAASRREKARIGAQLRSLVPTETQSRIAVEAEAIESADIVGAVTEEAERLGADVICLGSHGRTGLAKTLLGSVAHGVMSRSARPILVVRGQT